MQVKQYDERGGHLFYISLGLFFFYSFIVSLSCYWGGTLSNSTYVPYLPLKGSYIVTLKVPFERVPPQ